MKMNLQNPFVSEGNIRLCHEKSQHQDELCYTKRFIIIWVAVKSKEGLFIISCSLAKAVYSLEGDENLITVRCLSVLSDTSHWQGCTLSLESTVLRTSVPYNE